MNDKFVTIKQDITGWNKTLKELQKIKGGTFKDIIRAECSEILQPTSIRKTTKLADKSKIVARHSPVNTFVQIYRGKKEAYTLKAGEGGVSKQTTYYLFHRLPNQIWNYILNKTRKRTEKQLGNQGLNKGQFLLMANKLRLPKGSKDYQMEAKKFIQKNSSIISNKVFASESGKRDSNYKIVLESRLSKVVSFAGGARNFKNVMKGRVRKLEQAIGKGILKNVKKRTKAYPLLFK